MTLSDAEIASAYADWQRERGVAKAQTGPGWVSLMTLPHISELSTNQNKLMAEAQALFHNQTWVAAAERAITGRYVRAGWHLEQADGDTVDKKATPAELAVLASINRPSENRSRRQLWSLTLRHMGLCGNAFWYLDQREALNGTPGQVLYVNPARMTPVENEANVLLGWLLDGPDNPVSGRIGNRGVPFTLEEIIHFKLDEPDSGHWGIGIAESAYAKLMIDRLTDTHTQGVLSSGGRIAGILSPKEGGAKMNEDEWQATVRDYRNITNDPDAAKRLHIVRGPVDFTETASNPSELQLSELSTASRENILAAWGVPLSQIGVMQSSGLNSGEHVKYEEAALWQGPIDYRGSAFEEKVQHELIDLYALKLVLVVDTPAFDDEQPLYLNAEKAKIVPLTVDQRLQMVGKDPLDPKIYGDLGSAIFIDQGMVRVDKEPEPKPIPPALQPFASAAPPVQEEPEEGPAKATPLRKRVEREFTPKLRESLESVFASMSKDIRRKVVKLADHLQANPSDSSVWWDEEKWAGRFRDALLPALQGLTRTTGRNTARTLPAKAGEDDYLDRVLAYVRTNGLSRIRGILRTTRDAVNRVIVTGVRDGLSPAALGDAIEAAAGLDEARAETIARTETMLAYNDAAIGTYREFGVAQVQAIDGDVDEECAARNGNIYSLDEASGISDHPNGTLDWVPIYETAKAEPDRMTPAYAAVLKAALEEADRPLPENPPPIVNIAAPPALPAPIVNMDTTPFAVALAELKATITKPRNRTVERDARGQIIRIVEE